MKKKFRKRWNVKALCWAFMGVLVGAEFAYSELPFAVYPKKGQSQSQQKKDVSACETWAKEQTGFDPMAELEKQQAESEQAGQAPKSGAGKGAAKGAIGAEIVGGDAETGAIVGGAAGGAKRRKEEHAQAQKKEQAAQAEQAKIDAYNQATMACLEGRGYTVR